LTETRRVVVTGIGALSPVGNTFAESWEALKAGVAGIAAATRFEAGDLPWNKAGELKGFSPDGYLSMKDRRRLDPFVQYAVMASIMAAEDAGLGAAELSGAAVVMGSTRGGISTMEDAGDRVSPYLMPSTTVSMAASSVARALGVKGHTLGISNACASGANAVGEAMRLIRHGLVDVAMAGGSEAPLCRFCVKGYGAAGALSKANVSRPFDRRRDGFVMAEGAAVLVLEEYESAMKRGAKPYGEVAGYGNTSDAFHQTVPHREGQARAMRQALEEARLAPADIGYINAHAASTPVGDIIEAAAIRLVFGANGLPVSSTKSMTGHMLGASGAFEAAVALMSLREGVLPPTVNLEEPEGGLNYIREAARVELRAALSNSFGFGGVNAVLVFKAL
jgi:3-oxoacyl-[acyl-carrier-protein] synthase II